MCIFVCMHFVVSLAVCLPAVSLDGTSIRRARRHRWCKETTIKLVLCRLYLSTLCSCVYHVWFVFLKLCTPLCTWLLTQASLIFCQFRIVNSVVLDMLCFYNYAGFLVQIYFPFNLPSFGAWYHLKPKVNSILVGTSLLFIF